MACESSTIGNQSIIISYESCVAEVIWGAEAVIYSQRKHGTHRYGEMYTGAYFVGLGGLFCSGRWKIPKSWTKGIEKSDRA